MHDPVVYVPLFSAAALLFLFSYVFGQRERSVTSIAFLLFAGGLSVVCFLEFLFYIPMPSSYSLILIKIAFFIYLAVGCAYLRFMHAVARQSTDGVYRLIFILTIVASLTSLIIPHHHIVADSSIAKNGFEPTKYYAYYLLITLITIFRSLQIGFSGWQRGGTVQGRQQAKLIFFGTGMSALFIVFFIGVLPGLLHNYVLYKFSSLSTVITAVFIYWAVSRYGLMTVDTSHIREISEVLFQNISDGVIISDEANNTVQVNRAAELIFGESDADLSSLHHLEHLFPEISFTSDISPLKVKYQRADDEKTLIITHSKIKNSEVPIGGITFIRDVTEQQKIEAASTWRNQLESLGRLAGGIAHDFNNQLTGIMGCADLMLHEVKESAEGVRLAEIIIKSAERSSQLTKQMLAFSRKGNYENRPVSINEIIGDVIVMLEHSIDKRIKITSTLTHASTVVTGDPNQIHNALLNIAINARDAMPEGGELFFVTKIVSLTREQALKRGIETAAEQYVTIAISDTGEGIPESIQSKIFEPFFTTKERGKGCGMGLAAVYGSILAHSGAIEVSSELGKGSSFTIFLPSCSEVLKCAAVGPRQHSKQAKKRILLIEDEEVVGLSLQKILTAAGNEVTLCNNGTQGIEVFRTAWNSIDIIILDLILPDITGQETFGFLKAIDPNAKVLLSSGYSYDHQVQAMLDGGACGFIQKPYLQKALLQMVEEAANS